MVFEREGIRRNIPKLWQRRSWATNVSQKCFFFQFLHSWGVVLPKFWGISSQHEGRHLGLILLQCRVIFTCVKFTFANKVEAMHERSLVSVKVEPCSTSRLSSALFTLPLFYLHDKNLRALTCVAKTRQWKSTFSSKICWSHGILKVKRAHIRLTYAPQKISLLRHSFQPLLRVVRYL